MEDNLNSYVSSTPQFYRFQLHNLDTTELLTLQTPPLEWESGIIEVSRDLHIGGVFTTFNINSLTFIKEGAKFLRDIWDEKEINGRCELIVSWFKFSTRSYIEMPSRFSLDFSTIKPKVKVGNQSIGVLIETVKEDILVKLENRRNVKIDITKNTSMGGFQIYPYINLKTLVDFDAMNEAFQSIWVSLYSPVTGSGTSGDIGNNKDKRTYTQFEMNFNSNEFNEAVEVAYKTDIYNINNITKFFNASSEEREITFFYTVMIKVTNRKGRIFSPIDVYYVFFDVMDGATVISSKELGSCGKFRGNNLFEGAENLTLQPGQSMRVYIRTNATGGIAANIDYSYFRVRQNIATYTGRTREGFPLYEATERLLQHITDRQFPLYSEFLGRTDTLYDKSNSLYISENQLRFAHIFSGLNLRGAIIFDPNNPLSISFDDLFQCINAIWNVGYEVEFRDNKRIRIENYDYFFQDVEAINLSSRIKRYDIETEVMPDFAFNSFLTGFEDYSYETINGRGEFNTENTRTSILNTDTEFDNISKIRGDTNGITDKLIKELDTEDTEEDNSLFILKTQRSGGNKWKPEKQENIISDGNTNLFGDDAFNLYFTPTRNLLRHGNRIKGAFLKYLQSKLRFQSSNKLQTLKTTGEGYTIFENEDILVNNLSQALYKPIKHTVTCQFDLGDFETLMSNPKGYITFTDEIKGYLLSLKKKNNEDKATIEIIEKV